MTPLLGSRIGALAEQRRCSLSETCQKPGMKPSQGIVRARRREGAYVGQAEGIVDLRESLEHIRRVDARNTTLHAGVQTDLALSHATAGNRQAQRAMATAAKVRSTVTASDPIGPGSSSA